jgi:hypothetical protein
MPSPNILHNNLIGNEASDPVYTKFMERVRRGGTNQVLRYSRWDEIEGSCSYNHFINVMSII